MKGKMVLRNANGCEQAYDAKQVAAMYYSKWEKSLVIEMRDGSRITEPVEKFQVNFK